MSPATRKNPASERLGVPGPNFGAEHRGTHVEDEDRTSSMENRMELMENDRNMTGK